MSSEKPRNVKEIDFEKGTLLTYEQSKGRIKTTKTSYWNCPCCGREVVVTNMPWGFITKDFDCGCGAKIRGKYIPQPYPFSSDGRGYTEYYIFMPETITLKPLLKITNKPKTVKEIVTQWLEANGYDGLCYGDCGCAIEDIELCGMSMVDCKPAYRTKCKGCHGITHCMSVDGKCPEEDGDNGR